MADEANEVSSFRFSFSSEARGRAVLEFETVTKPVRVSLSQEQLDRLATEAKIASVKLSWRSQGTDSDRLRSRYLRLRLVVFLEQGRLF
jgi:hypothetical protein